MPKDGFDFDDPLELNGVALITEEDTSGAMAECFAEEFMRMGYNAKQVHALFRNPHYLGMNMVLQNKGEAFVRDVIAGVFARWGEVATWPDGGTGSPLPAANAEMAAIQDDRRARSDAPCLTPEPGGQVPCGHGCACYSTTPMEQTVSLDEQLTDPMGNPIPKVI